MPAAGGVGSSPLMVLSDTGLGTAFWWPSYWLDAGLKASTTWFTGVIN